MDDKKHVIARKILQYGVIALIAGALVRSYILKDQIDFEKYCPFGGIQSLFTYLNNGNLACSMTAVNIVLGIALIIGIVLFGKLFCSFICPLGTVSEFLGKLGLKYNRHLEPKGITDKLLRSLKYILLFITLYFTLQASELFCKQYDPYYASVTGFGHKVNYLFAILAIAVFVIGSVFFRLFWCKYLCPLGAISNIFRYFLLILALIALYFLLLTFDLHIPFVIYLGAACLIGYIVEITKTPLQEIKMLKITRHEKLCIACGKCTTNCPQGIDVANELKVTHPDCNMCGDCVESCPESGALTINNIKIRWLPLLVVSALIILAMIVGHRIEVPSTEEYWGERTENEQTFFLSGLDQMSCVNMAKDYTSMFKEIDGVIGAATYLRSRSAKITYNPELTSEQQIRKSFFIPIKEYIREAPSPEDTVIVYKLQLDNNIAARAVNDIRGMLSERKIYQIETQFTDDIELLVFCHASVPDSGIVNSISGNRNMYNVTSIVQSPVTITGRELNKRNFVPFRRLFNNASQVPRELISIVSFELEEYPRNQSRFPFLINYLGRKYPSVIGLNVYYDSIPKADFYIIRDEMNAALLLEEINLPEYEVEYTNGKQEVVENLYRFRYYDKQNSH